jgi:predicted DNA-binding ribbon-helix-helix protein
MCNLYASQEPETYAHETRAIRLNGHCTSVRLETAFWDILQEIAEEEGTTVGRFASTLHGEVVERRGRQFRVLAAGGLHRLAAGAERRAPP